MKNYGFLDTSKETIKHFENLRDKYLKMLKETESLPLKRHYLGLAFANNMEAHIRK